MESSADTKRRPGRPPSFDRDDALRAAMLAFWRHGYETTSVSDLTAAMGLAAPSLYAAFGDKERLFLEAVRLYAGDPDDLARDLADAPTAREGARRMLLGAAEAFTGETTPRGCLLASSAASGSEKAARVQAAIAAIRRDVIAALEARIARDVDRGILPRDADPTALATLTVAVVQGLSVLARDGAGRATLVATAEAAVDGWPRSIQGS